MCDRIFHDSRGRGEGSMSRPGGVGGDPQRHVVLRRHRFPGVCPEPGRAPGRLLHAARRQGRAPLDALPHKTFTWSTRSLHGQAGSSRFRTMKGGSIGMRRKKHLFWLAAIGVFALVGVAAAVQPHPQTADVSAAFSADQVRSRSHTCTEGGNTFRITNAVWRGTSTSAEPRLAGNLVIATRTVLNETTSDGWLSGTWRTTPQASMKPGKGGRPRSNARLSAVIDNGNHFDGLATGQVRAPWARLLGNFSAVVNGNTITGELGANAPVAPDNSALLYRGGC